MEKKYLASFMSLRQQEHYLPPPPNYKGRVAAFHTKIRETEKNITACGTKGTKSAITSNQRVPTMELEFD